MRGDLRLLHPSSARSLSPVKQLAHGYIPLIVTPVNTKYYAATEDISFTCETIQQTSLIDHFQLSDRKFCSSYLNKCKVIHHLSFIKSSLSKERFIVCIHFHICIT